MRCNASPAAASGNCAVAAGGTVTVEMHAVCINLTKEWIGLDCG